MQSSVVEDQTAVLVSAGGGPRDAVVSAIDGLQKLREQKTLERILEEGEVGAVTVGEAAVVAIGGRCDIIKQFNDIVVNPSGVGKRTWLIGLITAFWF